MCDSGQSRRHDERHQLLSHCFVMAFSAIVHGVESAEQIHLLWWLVAEHLPSLPSKATARLSRCRERRDKNGCHEVPIDKYAPSSASEKVPSHGPPQPGDRCQRGQFFM